MQENILKNIFSIVKLYKKQFVIAILLVFISNCLLVLNPLIFRQAIMALDPHTGQNSGTLYNLLTWLLGPYMNSLTLWAILLIYIAALSAYLKYKMRIAFIAISRDAEADLRRNLFKKIQAQSSAFFDKHPIGELMSRLTNDVSAYRDVLGPGIMYPFHFITLVIPAQIGLFSISVPLALLSLVPILILPLLILFMGKTAYTTSLKVQEAMADMSTMVHETYSGIRIVKSYAILKDVLKRFTQFCLKFIGLNLRWLFIEGSFYPLLMLITRMMTIAMVLLAGYLLDYGWSSLSAADFVSFMWLQSFLFGPIMMLGWVLPFYIKGSAAYTRLSEVFREKIEVEENPKGLSSLPPNPSINFHNLSFTYPGSDFPVLSNINLEIKPATFLGITGPVGAGKTTLLRLLMRDYEISKGMIVIGEHDIHDYTLKALHKEMAIVEQNPFLFSKTIAENVRFGNEEASLKDLEVVTELADLHQTILRFPDTYYTLVGERGVTLSGGQKKRLAIARAFLVNRSIFLLDDIFSAVDYKTEKQIFDKLREKYAGKTVLLITQRVSILEKMDRILYMINGTVAEDGSPEELVKLNGHYAALVQLHKMKKVDEV